MTRHLLSVGILAVCWLGPALQAQETPVVFSGAHLIPIAGREIDRGTLIIQHGKIVFVGHEQDAPQTDGTRIDVSGKILMPGLVCTHSHIGGGRGGDRSEPIQPAVRIVDAINVRNSGFRRAVAGGLTTVNIMPGSGHLCSGQTAYVKLRHVNTIGQMLIRDDAGAPMSGLKMANGTNSQKAPPFPGTRGKSAYLVRQAFIEADEYRRKVKEAQGDPEKLPARDLDLEVLAQVLDGDRVVHHHTHRHDDIMTVIRLSQEYNFRVVLHHVSAGWRVADEIAAAGVPCSINILDSPAGKMESEDKIFITGGVLERAGVAVAYHTDDWVTDSRWFLRCAALGVRGGMTREAALESVTLAGAKMLDLDHRIGSLEPGKDADIAVLSGDPLSVYTKVLETWVEGRKVFDRTDPEDRLYAVGGPGAGVDVMPYMCCVDETVDE